MTKAAKTIKDTKARRAKRKPESKALREEYHDVVRRQTTRLRDVQALAARRRAVVPRLEEAERILGSAHLDAKSFDTVARHTALPLRNEVSAIDTQLYQRLRDYHTEQPLWENTAGRIMNEETELRGGAWDARIDKDYWRRSGNAWIQRGEMRNIGVAWANASGVIDYGQALPNHIPLFS